jgi:hypothetical protein
VPGFLSQNITLNNWAKTIFGEVLIEELVEAE